MKGEPIYLIVEVVPEFELVSELSTDWSGELSDPEGVGHLTTAVYANDIVYESGTRYRWKLRQEVCDVLYELSALYNIRIAGVPSKQAVHLFPERRDDDGIDRHEEASSGNV